VDSIGVDGAVTYADIMLAVEGMGVSLEIQPEVGPIIHEPIRTLADVERLRVIEPEESVPFLLEALGMVRRELNGRAALIGFGGAPFTLACYMIEGRPSRDYAMAKRLMLEEPKTWAALMEKLTQTLIRYLEAQVRAGAQVIQLFDSWVGGLYPPDYERCVLPYTRQVFEGVRATGVPTIHFGTMTAGMLEMMASAGSDIVSVDWRITLDEAWRRIGYDKGIQGNLDPVRVLAGWPATREAMEDILLRAGGRPGHVFNLGHGVLPDTDPDILRRLVDEVHAATARS
jgi:uroporphyrinogen decarboxylase